jgi:hypothetical protein
VSEGVVMEDGGFYIKVEKVKGKWERPRWVREEDAVRAERLAERLQKVLDEFNKNTTRLKTELQLRYCKPSVCGGEVRVFYDVMLKGEGGEEVATITYEWNITDDVKTFVFVMADTYIIRLEDTLNILHLTGKLAVEFYR